MSNYYELLGISQGASEEDIRAKLKEKKRIWIQRENAPKPEQQKVASKKLSMVPEIEATLFDPDKRDTYDKELRNAPKAEAQIDPVNIEPENLIQEGWRLFSEGNLPDALMVATRATDILEKNPDAWALLGYCKAQWGEPEDAISDYKKAIDLRPNDDSFYFELGSIYESIEQWEDAIQQYEHAAQIDPNKTVYRASMGSVFIKCGMYTKGIALLEDCIEEEPENEGYKYLLALAYNDSVVMSWDLTTDGSRVCCTKEAAKRSIEYLEKAIALNIDDEDLSSRITENYEIATWNIQKHWCRSLQSTLKSGAVAIIFGVILAIILKSQGYTALGMFIGIGIVLTWAVLGYKYGYQINSESLEEI